MQTGPGGNLPVGYSNALSSGAAPGGNGFETRINRFDANGHTQKTGLSTCDVMHQRQ